MSSSNGAKGRAAPPPLTYTFPNGVTATVTPLSQFTIAKLEIKARREIPKPEPPLAPGVGGELQPNEADPDYEAARQAYETDVQNRLMYMLFEVALDVEVDAAALTAVRARLARVGEDLSDEYSERVAYIRHCCFAGSRDLAGDMQRLAMLITGQAAPTEADVQAHVETFQGDVGRS
jgi:hypothetical protein